jgi:hypothetical protein
VEKKMKSYYPTKKPAKLKMPLIAAWDVETDDLGGELLGVSYCLLNSDGRIVASDLFTGENMLGRLVEIMMENPNHIWNAHHSQYDWRYLLPYLVQNNYTLEIFMCTDSKILCVKVNDSFEMRDSFLLIPEKLKYFTESFAPDHAKMQIDDISNWNPKNSKHREYAIVDSESLAIALYNYTKYFVDIWGVLPSRTSPASAMKAWLTTLPEPIHPHRWIENFVRNAYYGGYVAPLHTGKFKNVRKYDINSSYPASMKLGIPAGVVFKCSGDDWDNETAGFFYCEVVAPKNLIVPVIPARRGLEFDVNLPFEKITLPKTQSLYPNGEFKTIISTIEIQFARSIGYEIKPIIGICFEDYIEPFNEFVLKCETLRAKYKGTATEKIVKWNQNSLYGKFASKRERREVGLLPDEPVGWTPLEALPEYGFITEYNDEMLAAPHIAAWITALSRINLFNAIYQGGAQHVLYCDTDSIIVTEQFDESKIAVGKLYGEFKHECTYELFRAHAPKVYAGTVNGIWEGACKGIPEPTESDFEKIYNGDIIEKEYKSLNSVMSYFEHDALSKAKIKTRKSTDSAKCTGWNINNFDRTDMVKL